MTASAPQEFPSKDEPVSRISISTADEPSDPSEPFISLFTVCLSAGLVAILVAALIPPGAGFVRLALAIFAPLAAMVTFITLGKDKSEINKFADSIYYMGFIFTLIALVVAFVLPRMAASAGYMTDSAAMLRSDQLMESFGVALVTTVFGITARTLMLQSQTDAFDAVNSFEADMLAYGAEATSQMKDTVAYFKTEAEALRDGFSRQNQLFVEEMNAQTGQVHSALTEEYLGIFEKLKRDLSDVGDQAETFHQEHSGVTSDISQLRKTLNAMESNVAGKVDYAVGALRAIEDSIDDRILKAADAATQSLETLSDTIAPLKSSTDSMATSAKHLTKSSQAMSELGSQMGRLERQLADMESTIARMSGDLSGSSDAAIGELRGVVDRFSTSLAETRRLLQ